MIIFKQTIQRIIKNKVRFFIIMVIPLIFILVFAMQSQVSLSIDIVDKDGSALSGKLADTLRNMYQSKVEIYDENAVHDRIYSYQSDYCIIIEPGFEQKLLDGREPEIRELYVFEKEKLYFAKMKIESFVSEIKLLAAGVNYDKDKFNSALKAFEDGSLSTASGSETDGKKTQTRIAMGFMIQFMLYMSVITAGIILEDKSSGVFFRMFYAPVTLKRYITENLAAFLIVGVLQAVVILSLLKWVFGFYLGNSPVSFYILMIAFAIVCISLGTWLVSLFRKPLYAYLTIALITSPLVMLGGCYWPKEFMSDTVNSIARFLPTSWVMQSVDRLIYDGKNILDLGLEVFILLIFAAIFLAAGLIKKVDISR